MKNKSQQNEIENEEIAIYQSETGAIEFQADVKKETLWAGLQQIADLFDTDKSGISRHIKNIYQTGELEKKSTVAKIATVQKEGNRIVNREIESYNLDVILSVGYRVNSKKMMKRFGVSDPAKLPDFMAKGSNERNIPKVIAPQVGDILLEKSTASIFIGTYFEQMMKNRNINTLIFTGIATEIGVESSARDASNRGFYPVIAEDCVSSMDKDAHSRSLENMRKMFICENSKTIVENINV